jgi:hypothetical protein
MVLVFPRFDSSSGDGTMESKMSGPAALCALAVAMTYWAVPATAEVVIQAERAATRTEGGPMPGGGWNLWSNGSVGQPVRIAAPGTHQFVVRAWGSPAAGVWPEMALLVDGRAVKTVKVDRADPRDYQFTVDLAAGVHEVAAAFLNDAVIDTEDRNLYLQRITIRRPAGGTEPVLLTAKELAEATEAREREIVAQTQSAIEKHRKADATIRVVNAAGHPAAGAKVSVEQHFRESPGKS